ncbi:MAG: OsmC family protein [Clostridia bacterium]|nr:OsmC family protein [Clostridia bacterium]MCL6522867.1 OsmC family protein [Bacillota bacterium]
MAALAATVEWRGGTGFVARTGSGGRVEIRAAGEVQGAGGRSLEEVDEASAPAPVRPKEAVLAGLGGCTGIDVVSILDKMRQPLEAFTVEIEAEQSTGDPKVFTHLRLVYRFRGALEPARVLRAVRLSQEKYCGVLAMLAQTASVETRVELNGAELEYEPSRVAARGTA